MPLRRFTEAELVLTQRLHLERPLLVLVLLGAAGSALAAGSVIYLLLTVAGVGINAAALHRRSEVYVPRAIVNAAVLIATAIFIVEFVSRDELLPALGHYLILMQLCKLFEQKRNRDYAQLIALSLVLMVAGAITASGLWFGLLLLAYLPVACYVGMVLTLKVSLDRQASAHLAVESRPIDPHRVAWNVSTAFPRGALWRMAGMAAASCALAATAVFLVMPRLAPRFAPRLPVGRGRGLSVTGFASSIRLREVGRIRPDRRVVMRVGMTSAAGKGSLPASCRYLRGPVYDTYSDGSWFLWRAPLPRAAARRAKPPGAGNLLVQRVTMAPELLPTLFAVAPVHRVELPGNVELTSLHPGLTVRDRMYYRPIHYAAHSWFAPLTKTQVDWLGGAPGHRTPRAVRTGEAIPPSVAALARHWCADLLAQRGRVPPGGSRAGEMDLRIAERIADRLRKDYTYTLDVPAADPDRDPVEDLLFRTRAGHCELFASAMTLMCRALGLDARVATGYLLDGAADGGEYLVRQSDAHAWCEVYTPATDWRIFDPTPAGGRRRTAGALSRLRRLWDSMSFFWGTRVISYGESDRQRLLGGALAWCRSAWRACASFCAEAWEGLRDLIVHRRVGRDLHKAMLALAAVAAAAAAVMAWRALSRRRFGQPRRPDRPTPPAFYLRLLKLLRRRGVRPRPEQTAREFLLEAGARLGLPSGALTDLAAVLYRLRWGHAACSPAELDRADRIVRDLAGQLRRRRRAP